MTEPTLLQALVSLPFLHAFFIIVGADPKARATYYVGSPWSGVAHSMIGPDRTVDFLALGPMLWAIFVIVIEQANPLYCNIQPSRLLSLQTGFALATVFLVGKILIGPVLESRKSIKIVGEQQFTRPFSFMVYDALMSLPLNVLTGSSFKLLFVGALSAALWLLFKTGLVSKDNSFVPLSLIAGWVLVTLGRLSGLMITYRVSHHAMLVAYLGSILMLAFVWMHAEALLKGCGVDPGVLPSYGSVILSTKR